MVHEKTAPARATALAQDAIDQTCKYLKSEAGSAFDILLQAGAQNNCEIAKEFFKGTRSEDLEVDPRFKQNAVLKNFLPYAPYVQ